MKSGVIILMSVIALILNTSLYGQQIGRRHMLNTDSIAVYKNVSEVSVQNCLGNLLQAIVKSNSKYYKQGVSFYGLHISNRKKYWYLEIFIDQWHGTKDTSYTAMLKMKNAVFLCSGDLRNNSLFSKVGLHCQKIKFVASKKQIEPMLMDPSLQGTLNICSGLPIYVEVYTPDPIQGYQMNVKKH
ncbi:hypothetical protein ACFFGT_08445 [Mucilaginibacter angelicae]|uniref:Uncharacterized protein n=1 Tax=Mucilaginibacter angelicae TaxID=869718 RepID=A0ABV6L424_9SPHI